MIYFTNLRLVVISACLLAMGPLTQSDAAQLGNIQANNILFLGNSITTCGSNYWGLAASAPEKDYAHLLASAIDAKTGGHLTLIREVKPITRPDGSVDLGESNVINVANVFERSYTIYNASKIRKQLDWKADIVILQLGENVPLPTFNAEVFTNSLKKLVADLKASSNPHIFISSFILGSNAAIDDIKRKICAEDPHNRIFVDLTSVYKDPANIGEHYHLGDKGMATIAKLLFDAIQTHSSVDSESK